MVNLSRVYKVLIPFKIGNPKTRLDYENGSDGFLYLDERRALALRFLVDVYSTWIQAIQDQGDVVVGLAGNAPDEALRELRRLGVDTVQMPFDELNRSMKYFGHEAAKNAYERYVVCGSDVPLIMTEDIELLQRTGGKYTRTSPGVVLFEGNLGGTTCYLITPPTAYEIELSIEGKTNLNHQLNRFRELSIPYDLLNTRNLFLDIDYPEDLIRLLLIFSSDASIYSGRGTYEFLMSLSQELMRDQGERGDRFRNLYKKIHGENDGNI